MRDVVANRSVLMLATVGFFRKAAEMENESTLAWAGASLVLWVVSIWALGWGLLGGFALQVGLFAALTVRNMLRK